MLKKDEELTKLLSNVNKNCIVFMHNPNNGDYDYTGIINICTKKGLSLFNCANKDLLLGMIENLKPMYIVLGENEDFDKEYVENLCSTYPNSYIFLLGKEKFSSEKDNCIFVDNMLSLCEKIRNHNKFVQSHMLDFENNSKLFYNYILLELDKLSFRAKLIGEKYLADLIYEFYFNSKVVKNKCGNAYLIISKRYDTNPIAIERLIRFAITKAFDHCQDKQKFYDISKKNRLPSTKELAGYVTNKLVYILGSDSVDY